MILQEGDKLLVVYRRLFESDKSRYFIGVVDGYENGVAKVSGHTWMKEQFGGSFFKKGDLRTKILSLSSGTLITYELPQEVVLSTLKFEHFKDGQEILTDGSKFKMNLAENEHQKHEKRPS